MRAVGPPPWVLSAVCATHPDPDLWFPPRGPDPGREAKAFCAACPVAAECLEYALSHSIREGIWGGVGEGDRRLLHRRRVRRARQAAERTAA
jgi:WhiB family transcriptional regulator, redox-sensing transcriptional regulator